MVGKIKFFIFSVVLGNLSAAFAQTHNLPQPQVMASTAVPPPPGLPLPIDDYLPYLLLAGILYGSSKILKFKKN